MKTAIFERLQKRFYSKLYLEILHVAAHVYFKVILKILRL